MPTFSRGEITIHFEVHGSGPPLLLLAPGGMRSAIGFWDRQPYHPVREFAEQFRVIAMDQRNAGESRAPISAADGWHSYTDDHLALLDQLEIERCHLLGGCIGAAFALALIERAPERVRSAVLQQPIGWSGSNREVFYELVDGWALELSQQRQDVSLEAVSVLRENMYGRDFVFSVARDVVARCPVPLLVLRGNDVYHPASTSAEITRLAPNAELISDWKTGDDVQRAVARVRAFLLEH